MIKLRRKKKEQKIKILDSDSDVVKLNKLLASFERVKIGEYIEYLGKPWRIIWTNILVGVSRGVGLTLGMALIIIIIIKILVWMIAAKFPWLSDASQQMLAVIKTTPGLERFVDAVEIPIEAHGGHVPDVVPAGNPAAVDGAVQMDLKSVAPKVEG